MRKQDKLPADTSAHKSHDITRHPARPDSTFRTYDSDKPLSPEGTESARKLRNQRFFTHVLLVMLMSVLGDAVFFATFIKGGDFVLSLVVPYSLDPTGVYQAAVTPSSVAAILGASVVGIPRLVAIMVPVACNLDECVDNQSLDAAVRWRERRIWQFIPAPVAMVAVYAWEAMAGPFGVWIHRSWPSGGEVLLEAWHAAGAALLGRLLLKAIWAALWKYVGRKVEVRIQELAKERELKLKGNTGSAARAV